MEKRRNGYYLRMRVPDDLKPIYKKTAIIRTLKTSDYYEAKTRLAVLKAEWELDFAEKRKSLQLVAGNPDMLSQYTDKELERLAKSYFLSEYEKQSQEKKLPDNWGAKAFEEHLINLEIDLKEYQDEVDGVEQHPAHHGRYAAERLLKQKNITFNADGEEIIILAQYMSRALAELTRMLINQRKKLAYQVSDTIFDLNKLDKQKIEEELKPKVTISDLFEEHLNNPATAKTDATKKSYDGIQNVVYAYWGKDKDVRDIMRQDCKDIFNVLLTLPAHLKKKAPNLTLQQGIQKGSAEGWDTIAPKTINGYMGSLSAVLQYAVEEDYIIKNPAYNLRAAASKEKQRLPYTLEQLQAVFGSDFYDKAAIQNKWHIYPNEINQKHADMFWIPLISLYTGARMNEICQLTITDIKNEKDINYFDITTEGDDEENKSLKNIGSKRKVPIHFQLINMGFLEYIDWVQSHGHERLFYDIKTGHTGKYSDLFTKRFAYHLKKYNLKFPKTTFHSFRHSFRDECREQEIPDSVAEAICGWAGSSKKNEADKYGTGPSMTKINDYLQRLKYDGLDLSHLYLENAKDGLNNTGEEISPPKH